MLTLTFVEASLWYTSHCLRLHLVDSSSQLFHTCAGDLNEEASSHADEHTCDVFLTCTAGCLTIR